jgi:molybdopterin biosynthesis enzyme MoaB
VSAGAHGNIIFSILRQGEGLGTTHTTVIVVKDFLERNASGIAEAMRGYGLVYILKDSIYLS